MHSQVDNDVSQATAASLATFFKQIGLADANGMLDRSISFITRDKRASWLKSSKKVCKSVTVCNIDCDSYTVCFKKSYTYFLE